MFKLIKVDGSKLFNKSNKFGFKNIIFNKLTYATLITFGISSSIYIYENGFDQTDFYYLMNGVIRGTRSIHTGAKIAFNYKIVITFNKISLLLK